MKKFVSILTICIISTSTAFAAPSVDRRSMSAQWGSASRATAPRNQIGSGAGTERAGSKTDAAAAEADAKKRAKEKEACINNNIGIGNTFVWASRYSNTGNYASMVEDTEVPENNVCFVRVELKSDDTKVKVTDIQPVYYEMGRNITCGGWTDADALEKRILDAKKSSRTWGTVAGAVGGAGIGVGAMELFGNKLIGGSVQGQKALKENELLRSQMLVFQKEKPAEYEKLMTLLQSLKAKCESTIWNESGAPEKPAVCDTYKSMFNSEWLNADAKK